MKSKFRFRRSRKFLKRLIAVECFAVVFCCAGIYNIAYGNNTVISGAAMSVIQNKVSTESVAADKTEDFDRWIRAVLSRGRGSVQGPSGKETYYNLNMSGVVSIMRRMGNNDEYWVREDGCKMLGKYIMVAANLKVHPRGSLVDTSLGKGIVCDTGGFAKRNPHQIDIAVNW